MLDRQGYQDFMTRVGSKIRRMQPKMIVKGQRNAEAVNIHTNGRILQAAKNLYFSQNGDVFDPVESIYRGFSAGYGDVAGLEARGIEDITILGTIRSVVAFIAIERSMDNPEQSITFQKLVAMADSGDVSEGDFVRDPFSPHNLDVDLRLKTSSIELSAGASGTATFSASIVKGAVLVKIVGSGVAAETYGTLEGRDYEKDGKITFRYTDTTGDPGSGATLVAIPSSVSIDYNSGTVTVSPVEADTTTTIVATIDATKDSTGANTLRVKPEFETEILIARPNNVVLESSLESEAYRNKMMQNAMDAGMTIDMGEIAFRQLLEMYVEYINARVTNTLISAGEIALVDQPSGNYIEVDLSSYDFTSFAPTKDDKVQDFFLRLNTQLLKSCGKGGTALLVGTEGANILANIEGRFVPNANFNENIDGMIGTFNNVPVIRHRSVDSTSDSTYSNIYMLYKSPDGKAGPVAFGEYLPMYSTRQVLNFNNPTQFAQALFSYLGTQTIVPRLVAVGRFKYTA